MKRGIPIKFAKIDSPSTSEDWKLRSEKDRLSLIEDSLKNFPESEKINLKKVSVDGQLIISFEGILNAGERGVLLLDFEEYLKDKIDLGITVWHESIGDKNSLRNLRGIEVIPMEEI